MREARISDLGRLVFHKRKRYKGKVKERLETNDGEYLVVELMDAGSRVEMRDRIGHFRFATYLERCPDCGVTIDNKHNEICPKCESYVCAKPSCRACACRLIE